jgi:hypothetical protein
MNSAWASSHQNKPPDNANVESFNGLGKEYLDATWFMSLDDARGKLEARQQLHNESRRNSVLTSAPRPNLPADAGCSQQWRYQRSRRSLLPSGTRSGTRSGVANNSSSARDVDWFMNLRGPSD